MKLSYELNYARLHCALLGSALLASCGGNNTPPAPADTTRPTVIATTPTPGAISVAINIPINVTFSEPMDASTLNNGTILLSSNNGIYSGTVSYTGTTATFTPTSGLTYAGNYTVIVTTGVKDLAGNALATNYSWGFFTPSTIPTSHQVIISWDANREADVNRAGGGYIIAISGQPNITVPCPCSPTKPSKTLTLMSGSYITTVNAYTAISKTTGLAGLNNGATSTFAINVP